MNNIPYDSIKFGELALQLRSLRHELLSSNLINADTPNYKARDIDFAAVLRDALAGALPSPVGLQLSHPRHISGQAPESRVEQLYRIPIQPSIDGNTVDPDIERGHFVRNAMMTESTLSFLGGSFKTRLSAVTGQTQ